MPLFRERDCRRFSDVPDVRRGNSRSADRHGIDACTKECFLETDVVLNVVCGPQNGVRNTELTQRLFNRKLRRKVRHVHLRNPRYWRWRMHMNAKQQAYAASCGIAGNYATSGGPTYCISYRANTSASIFGPFGTAT